MTLFGEKLKLKTGSHRIRGMETEWLKFKVASNRKFKPLKQYMLLMEIIFRINLPPPFYE